MALDGFNKGRPYTTQTHLGNTWTQIWDEYEACVQNGINITVINVKSHETVINIVPRELQLGNGCADYHAGQAVIEAPSGEVRRIRNIDSKARWFQERMIHALLLLHKNGRHPQENQHLGEGGI